MSRNHVRQRHPRNQPLESDPRFLRHIEEARSSLREGRGVKLEDVDWDALDAAAAPARRPSQARTKRRSA